MDAVEATEPVEALRKVPKEVESRLDLRGIPPADGGPEGWRGTLELAVGETRID